MTGSNAFPRATALFAMIALTLAWPATAAADECDECIARCDKGVGTCQKAAGPMCKIPGFGGICFMFKNGQCIAKGNICRMTDCGLMPNCAPGPSLGGGQVSGDPHIYTLDRTYYDLQGAGEYVVARSAKADVEIQGRFVPRGDRASVTSTFAIRTAGRVVVFDRERGITVDQQPVSSLGDGVYLAKHASLQPVSSGRVLLTHGETRVWVAMATTYLNVVVEPDPATRGSWEGLLGDFDGNHDNDLKARDGTTFKRQDMTKEILYGGFAGTWRVTEAESILPYAKGETTATFTDLTFPKVHVTIATLDLALFTSARATCLAKGVPPGPWLHRCIFDVAVTGADEFADGYADARPTNVAASLTLSGTTSMRTQAEGYQGEVVPVFWSTTGPGARLTMLDDKAKLLSTIAIGDENPLPVRMPSDVGTYTLRLTDGDHEQSQTITIVQATATVTAPATVGGAMEFEVTWTGPRGRGDYIALMKPGSTNPSKFLAFISTNQPRGFQAPATPGTYELWYVLQGATGRTAIAKTSFTVTKPAATLVAPSEEVHVGGTASVGWTGPNGRGDWIDLVPVGTTKFGAHLSLEHPRHSPDGKASLRVPALPGVYTIRYVASTSVGRAVLATTTLKVLDATATLAVPATVAPGAAFELECAGPTNRGDFISIARANEPRPDKFESHASIRAAGKLRMTAPAKAGTYEVRYVLQGSDQRRVLARAKLTVRAP